nr:Na(+)/H(+) antiporter subunit F1 [Kurthia massiliensis]
MLLIVCMIIIAGAMFGFIYRLIKGPSTPDRVIALDAIGVALIALVGMLSVFVNTSFYVDIVLLLAILSFIGTLSFAKFLEKGKVIDRGDE